MSNWYVRRSRERFWVKGMPQDKINAYMTLYTALVTVAKTAAPMIPFMTEDIYRNLVCSIDKNAPESVHLCDFPVADESMIDKQLEEDMELVLEIVVLGRAARNSANIKNRQPIGEMFIKSKETLSDFYQQIIREELNVKKASFTDDVSDFKPQMRTLGPKYGKQLGEIRALLQTLDGGKAKKELDTNGVLKLTLQSGEIELAPEDLLIETAKSDRYATEEANGVTVVLDTQLTPELLEEGFVREVISKIQTMRKEAGFDVTDSIHVYVNGSEKIIDIVKRNLESVREDVLAEAVHFDGMNGYTKEWDINGEAVTIGVEKK